jgi:hypothetical protein
MADNTQTFDDLVAAAVEETPWNTRAAWEQTMADRKERWRVVTAQFKSDLETCLDPVITAAGALRYEDVHAEPRDVLTHAVLTVDGDTWRIYQHLGAMRFTLSGPQYPGIDVDKEKLQTTFLSAIAQRRKQRNAANKSE